MIRVVSHYHYDVYEFLLLHFSALCNLYGLIFHSREILHCLVRWLSIKTASGSTYQGAEYWVTGKTYNFYAIYPADVPGSEVTDAGSITITDFDCSLTGDEAVDLMTASATDVSADGMIYNSGSVSLQFRHLLSLLNFSFENQLTSHAIDITNLRLSVAVTGDCQSSPSPTWVNLASDKTELILHPAGNPLQVGKKRVLLLRCSSFLKAIRTLL